MNGASLGRPGAGLAGDLFAAGEPRGSMPLLWHPATVLVVRLILAAVFVYAAVQKIGKPLLFADEIAMYRVLDRGLLVYTMAIVLPWVELFCGISLVTGLFMRGSALILALLNLMFIGVIAFRTAGIMRAEGTPFMEIFFDCGCGFGVTYAWKKLIEDFLLLAASLVVLFAPAYRWVVYARRKDRP
ncbi:MAG: DoxX family membrane protein [Candidatus Krumholzibacteriota bacterium]|nr:DoxX family membrane protein [Candidatus Krumholzibacteriota bacterium]